MAVLTTRARLTRQWSAARQQLRAAEAADALLATWWQDVKTFPRNADGPVPHEPGMSWRTRVVPNERVNWLDASVVRLEILDARDGPARGEVLASVELVLDDAQLNRRTAPARAAAPSP